MFQNKRQCPNRSAFRVHSCKNLHQIVTDSSVLFHCPHPPFSWNQVHTSASLQASRVVSSDQRRPGESSCAQGSLWDLRGRERERESSIPDKRSPLLKRCTLTVQLSKSNRRRDIRAEEVRGDLLLKFSARRVELLNFCSTCRAKQPRSHSGRSNDKMSTFIYR